MECAGKRILIGCGSYQGGRELDEENVEPFGFEPCAIDYVLLTHAHLDYCGRLPLLVKRGFQGEIITAAESRELARVVLLDAGHLQEEEARYHALQRACRGVRALPQPRYRVLDALNTMEYFGRTAVYGQALELAPGLRATFLDAGHILGSACVHLALEEGGQHRSVAFSGDLSNAGRPLLRNPVPPPKVDALVMETAYASTTKLSRGGRPSEP